MASLLVVVGGHERDPVQLLELREPLLNLLHPIYIPKRAAQSGAREHACVSKYERSPDARGAGHALHNDKQGVEVGILVFLGFLGVGGGVGAERGAGPPPSASCFSCSGLPPKVSSTNDVMSLS